MKKIVVSILLIAVGVGLWFALSQMARFNVKKWDTTFMSVLRHGLTEMGFSDSNLVSSLQSIRKDSRGEWVKMRMVLENNDPAKIEDIKKKLEDAGAQVIETTQGQATTLSVRRGNRIYQEIEFLPKQKVKSPIKR